MLNSLLIESWILALRSGRYAQGQGYLRVGDMYCCLGVLCDVVNPQDWTTFQVPVWASDDIPRQGCMYSYGSDGFETELPYALRRTLGLTRQQSHDLTNMNDGLHYTFEDIADELRSLLDTGDWTKMTLIKFKRYSDLPTPVVWEEVEEAGTL